MELYRTEEEAIKAAEEATKDFVPFDRLNFLTQDLSKVGSRSVFYYDGEYNPHYGLYEVAEGDMATYGLAAYKIGQAEYGKFTRWVVDSHAEMARKMMGLA